MEGSGWDDESRDAPFAVEAGPPCGGEEEREAGRKVRGRNDHDSLSLRLINHELWM